MMVIGQDGPELKLKVVYFYSRSASLRFRLFRCLPSGLRIGRQDLRQQMRTCKNSCV